MARRPSTHGWVARSGLFSTCSMAPCVVGWLPLAAPAHAERGGCRTDPMARVAVIDDDAVLLDVLATRFAELGTPC